MEYNSIFEPLLCIFLSVSLGLLIGVIGTITVATKEHKALANELDKFRELYFNISDKLKNKDEK
tara:strand:+ start:1442 stop:1633 length:192 start_codon:yes stop_codon:yes gene_type:complete